MGKTGQAITDVIIQEGVLTAERINDAVAEPVVYLMDRYVVGGFYRVHAERGSDENLNAPGSTFVPLAFAEYALTPARQKPGASAPNRFYMYGVIGRLAMLAASYELEATDPKPRATTNRAVLSCCTATSAGAGAGAAHNSGPLGKTLTGGGCRDGALRAELEIKACGADHRRHRCRLWRHRHQRPVRRQGSLRLGPCRSRRRTCTACCPSSSGRSPSSSR